MRRSLTVQLILVYVFFLPLRGIQIPLGIFGFEINPSRIAIVIALAIVAINTALQRRYLQRIIRPVWVTHQPIFLFFLYQLFSILVYYLLVVSGQTLLFGMGEVSIFRNWVGRPIAQFISFFTYAVVPFFLIQYYATNDKRFYRSVINTFITTLYILIFFACVQIITYIIFREPIIGRQLLERRLDLGGVEFFGIPFYRVNSLGGEPRDFGTFLLGAIPLYVFARYDRLYRIHNAIIVLLMIILFLLTTSNSAFVALSLFIVAVLADIAYRRRARLRLKYLKSAFMVAILLTVLFRSQIINNIGSRAMMMAQAIYAQFQTSTIQPLVREQTSSIVVLYYLLDIAKVPTPMIMVGWGYSNFITPLVGLYQQYFGRTIEAIGVFTSDSFLVKLIVEEGVLGVMLYIYVYVHTLKLNSHLLHSFRLRNDVTSYNKTLWLRYSFIAFFITATIQNSYFYYIIMGLIVALYQVEFHRSKIAQQTSV